MAPSGSGGSASDSISASRCLSSRLLSRRIRSIALRLAVVVSHPPGFGGTPSTGHRSTAVANASAADSSARSRSPKRRASVATSRAHCSWWARVIRSVGHAQERPHLDPSVAGLRPVGHERERGVEVGRVDDPEAGDVLLRLDEGPVGEDRLVTSAVDDRRGLGCGEAAREHPVAPGPEPLVELVDRHHLLGGPGVGPVVDHGNQVLHLTPPRSSCYAYCGRPEGR